MKLLLPAIVALFTISCKHDNGRRCEASSNAYIISARAVDKVRSGQQVDMKLEVLHPSGCGGTIHLETTETENIRTVFATGSYNSCAICPAYLPKQQVIYSFTPPKPGTYYFRFRDMSDKFILDTVVAE